MRSQSPLPQWHISSDKASPTPTKLYLLVVPFPLGFIFQTTEATYCEYLWLCNFHQIWEKFCLFHIFSFHFLIWGFYPGGHTWIWPTPHISFAYLASYTLLWSWLNRVVTAVLLLLEAGTGNELLSFLPISGDTVHILLNAAQSRAVTAKLLVLVVYSAYTALSLECFGDLILFNQIEENIICLL